MKRFSLIFACCLILSFFSVTHAAVRIQGKVQEVTSGDRFLLVSDNGTPYRVKLTAVAAPVERQTHHELSREHLKYLILGRSVQIDFTRAVDGAFICRVTLISTDIGLQMIRDGAAWFYELEYGDLPDGQLYRDSQQAARNERRGIWQDSKPIAPWEFIPTTTESQPDVAKANALPISSPERVNSELPRPVAVDHLSRLNLSPLSKTASLHYDKQRYSQSAVVFKQALNSDPKDIYAHLMLGQTLMKLKKYDDAIISFKQALSLAPNEPNGWKGLGVGYRLVNRIDDAINAYQQALRLSPNFLGAVMGLGECYQKLNRPSEAVKYYEQALKIDPKDAVLHTAIASMYSSLGLKAQAIKHYEVAVNLKPEVDTYLLLGLTYLKAGSFDKSIPALTQAVRMKPKSADAHFSLGSAFLLVNQDELAFQEYEALKGLDAEKANTLREAGIMKAKAAYKHAVAQMQYLYQNRRYYISRDDFALDMMMAYKSHHRFFGSFQGALE